MSQYKDYRRKREQMLKERHKELVEDGEHQ